MTLATLNVMFWRQVEVDGQPESREAAWCQRHGLSPLALHAVHATAEAVLAALVRENCREALWHPPNCAGLCPPALLPARAAGRPVRCDLASVRRTSPRSTPKRNFLTFPCEPLRAFQNLAGSVEGSNS